MSDPVTLNLASVIALYLLAAGVCGWIRRVLDTELRPAGPRRRVRRAESPCPRWPLCCIHTPVDR